MAAFAARVMMVNESIISLGGASSRSVSKLSRDGGLTHGDLPQILWAFVSWLFKTRVPPWFACTAGSVSLTSRTKIRWRPSPVLAIFKCNFIK
jgi:hypothetical protein